MTATPANPHTKTVTISARLPSGRYLSRILQVADTPRRHGRIELNHKSVWIHRFVRAFNDIGVHKAGEWMPRTARYPLTANRKRLIEALHHADAIKPEQPEHPPEMMILTTAGWVPASTPITFRPLNEEWTDPHEVEMRRLYAEQERHQIEMDDERPEPTELERHIEYEDYREGLCDPYLRPGFVDWRRDRE